MLTQIANIIGEGAVIGQLVLGAALFILWVAIEVVGFGALGVVVRFGDLVAVGCVGQCGAVGSLDGDVAAALVAGEGEAAFVDLVVVEPAQQDQLAQRGVVGLLERWGVVGVGPADGCGAAREHAALVALS